MTQECKNCYHSMQTNRTEDGTGHVLFLCQRNPPEIVIGEMGMILNQSAWPTVRHNAKCGEWKSFKDPHWTDPEFKELLNE